MRASPSDRQRSSFSKTEPFTRARSLSSYKTPTKRTKKYKIKNQNSQPVSPEQGSDAVVAAHAAGINFFDTSPYYGDTKSETVLAGGLARLDRSSFVLATKVGRYGGGNGEASVFDFSRSRVVSSVAESMRRLKVDRIDLVQCHDVEFADDLGTVITEAIPALLELKKQGVIGAVGVTGLPLTTLRRVIEGVGAKTTSTSSSPSPSSPSASPIDCVLSYCRCCLNDHALLEEIPYYQSQSLGIINASVLSMGLLSEAGPPSWHPAPEKLKVAAREAARVAREEFGLDLADLAIRESLSTPGVASHLIGISSAEQAEANVKAALRALEPPTEVEAKAMARVKEVFAEVQGMSWSSGKPENC